MNFSKNFRLFFLALLLSLQSMSASSSSNAPSNDDDGDPPNKTNLYKNSNALPSRNDLLKQFQRLSGYPEPGYYCREGNEATKVPEGFRSIFSWSWSYDIRVLVPLGSLVTHYTDEQLVDLMAREDFHSSLSIAPGNYVFWRKIATFSSTRRHNPRSDTLDWHFFIIPKQVIDVAQDVHNINFSHAKLHLLPKWPCLSLVRKMDLSHNNLEDLPIGGMPNLKDLNLSHNRFTEAPDVIKILTSLESLDLEGNKLSRFPDGLNLLPKLAYLDVSSNDIAGTLSQAGILESLTHLFLNGNKIQKIDPSFFTAGLLILNLSDNHLDSLPEEVKCAEKLTELYVNGNKLRTLPPSIGSLKNLEKFRANDNQLEELPPEMFKLTSLKVLDLSHNMIKELPGDIAKLNNLMSFSIAHNSLGALPGNSLSGIGGLKTIDVSHNKLATLAHQALPSALEVLRAHGNPINQLPCSFFFMLPSLKSLIIDLNVFREGATGHTKISISSKAGNPITRISHLPTITCTENDDSDDDSESES